MNCKFLLHGIQYAEVQNAKFRSIIILITGAIRKLSTEENKQVQKSKEYLVSAVQHRFRWILMRKDISVKIYGTISFSE